MLKKMNVLAGIFVASLFASVHAATHVIPYDTYHEVNLVDGDELLLKDFPDGWGYSNVYLGVNAAKGKKLSGVSLTNDRCVHNLGGDYQEIIYSHNGEKRIKYSGVPQTLPIHWWVNNAPAITPCSEMASMTHEDSLSDMIEAFQDSAIEIITSDYFNLDSLNKEFEFEGSEGHFKVTNLPSHNFNVIRVQVASADGRPLNGAVYSGATLVNLSSNYVEFGLQKKGPYDPTFEIAFPETRSIRLKWWTITENPSEKEVYVSSTSDADSIEAEYYFDGSIKNVNFNKVKLKYAKNSFYDNQAPSIKKLSFMPAMAKTLTDQGMFVAEGYNIHAAPAYGESVTIALPLTSFTEEDSIVISHYIDSERRWEYIPIDSISNGFVYFQTTSFSNFFVSAWRKIKNTAASLWDSVTDFGSAIGTCFTHPSRCPKELASFTYDQFKKLVAAGAEVLYVMVDGFVTMASTVADGLFTLYSGLTSIICGDISPLTNLFKNKHSTNWSIPQGEVNFNDLATARFNGQERYLDWINAQSLQPLTEIPAEASYVDRWKITTKNLDIVLADYIASKFPGHVKRFTFKFLSGDQAGLNIAANSGLAINDIYNTTQQLNHFDKYFESKSEMLKKMKTLVEGLKKAYNVTNLDGIVSTNISDTWGYVSSGNFTAACKEFLGGFGLVDWTHDLMDVSGYIIQGSAYELKEALTMGMNFNPFSDILSNRDEWLQYMSSAMTRVSLLAWLDKSEFRPLSKVAYASVYDGLRTWLELASPIYGYNNLSILANASLALFEFVHYGTEDNIRDMNLGMSRHYGTSGEFSEGTGYSQYIWDEVPYIVSALQQAYSDAGRELVLDWGFLNSGVHMADMSRPLLNLGYIPVEIDDGCTYNPDFLVWSAIYSRIGRISDASRLAALAAKYPLYDAQKKSSIMAVGVPLMANYGDAYVNYESHLLSSSAVKLALGADAGLITVAEGGDTVALSMIAEDGPLWENGQSHDQQDNLSITLTSAKKGFLIMDRGYAGFDARKDASKNFFSSFIDHNVLTEAVSPVQNCSAFGATFAERRNCINAGMEVPNTVIKASELKTKVEDFGKARAGVIWGSAVPRLISVLNLAGADLSDLLTAGGSAAGFSFVRNDVDAIMPLVSVSAIHTAHPSLLTNNRTIMYFDGNVWVLDRPNKQGTVWSANSPVGLWNATGMKLYGSENAPLFASSDVAGVLSGHIQNGSRPDYITPDQVAWFKQEAPVLQDVLRDAALCDKSQNFMFWYTLQDDNASTYVMNYKVGATDFAKVQDQYCPAGYQCFENADGSSRMVVPPQAGVFGFYGFDLKNAFREINTSAKNPIVSTAAVAGKRLGVGEWILKSVDGYMYINGLATKTVKVHPSYIEYEVIVNGASVFVPYSLIDNSYLPALPLLLL